MRWKAEIALFLLRTFLRTFCRVFSNCSATNFLFRLCLHRRTKASKLAATILALSVLFANGILMNIPWFADYKGWFITHHLNLWQWVFLQPAPTTRIIESLCLLAGFNVSFFAIGAAAFQARDIKS